MKKMMVKIRKLTMSKRLGGGEIMEHNFIIDENRKCYINGQEIENVFNVDIKNISATGIITVLLTVDVDSVDVKYKSPFK